MYTENLRESFRTVGIGRSIFLRLYAKFKLPFAPIYGGFPVKLISHIGKPIDYDPNLTPEELQQKVTFYFIYLLKLSFPKRALRIEKNFNYLNFYL